MILALLGAAALRYSAMVAYANKVNQTNATLDAVEAALSNFRYLYQRLPCPASLTDGTNTSTDPGIENNSTFGVEAGSATGGVGTGECVTGMTPAANYENTSTDPDGTGGTDPGAPDPLYDSATLNQVEAGGIPTKTLGIADSYAYDAWGKRILYAVDKRMTALDAFPAYPVTTSGPSSSGASSAGAIAVKRNATDSLANAITYKAIYALVSFGANGHGGYVRNLAATPSHFNYGSTDTNELKNCHCTSAVVNTAFDRIFVQQPRTAVYSNGITDVFDDIVRYKTRSEMASTTEMQ